jgi:proline dehydrogenase
MAVQSDAQRGTRPAQAYKYVPFGLVAEVLPYLIRRAQENSTVLGGVAQEKALVAAELGRRMRRSVGLRT